jgi:hypothetical protein
LGINDPGQLFFSQNLLSIFFKKNKKIKISQRVHKGKNLTKKSFFSFLAFF